MPKHSVIVDLPARPIARADAKFHVKSNGRKFGMLAISKGAVVWYPFNSPYGRKLSWEKFDEMMINEATRFEVRR